MTCTTATFFIVTVLWTCQGVQAFAPNSNPTSTTTSSSSTQGGPSQPLPVASRILFDFPINCIDSKNKGVEGVQWEDFANQWKSAFEVAHTAPEQPPVTHSTTTSTATPSKTKEKKHQEKQKPYLHFHPKPFQPLQHLPKPQWDKVWKTSTEVASSAAGVTSKVAGVTSKVAQGTWWLVADTHSPVAPLRRLAAKFVADRATEAKDKLTSEDTRRQVWHTTQAVGSRLVETSKHILKKRHIPSLESIADVDSKVHDFLVQFRAPTNDPVVDEEILWIQQMAKQFEAEVKAQEAAAQVMSSTLSSKRDPELVHRELLRTRLALQAKEAQRAKHLAAQQKAERFQRKLLETRLQMQMKKDVTTKSAFDRVEVTPEVLENIVQQLPKLDGFQREQLRTAVNLHLNNHLQYRETNDTSMPLSSSLALPNLSYVGANVQDTHNMHGNLNVQGKEHQAMSTDDLVEYYEKEFRRSSSGDNQNNNDDDDDDDEEQLVNTSLGLPSLNINELKTPKDDTVSSAEEELRKKRIRDAEEKIQFNNLMMELQRNSMKKKERARIAREQGSFGVIVAAMSQEEMTPRPTTFARREAHESDEVDSETTDLSFEELNKRIREKWEVDRIRSKTGGKVVQGTFVVNKLERRQPSKLERGVSKVTEGSVSSIRRMARKLVQLCVTRILGPTLESNGFLISDGPRKAPTNIPERTSWAENLHSV